MEKKIKIVFLCRDYGRVNRGVESYVKELSKRLSGKFDVSVFSGIDSDNIKKIINGKFDLVIPTNGRTQAIKVSLARIFGRYKILIASHAGIGRDEILNLLTFPDIYVCLTDYELNWAKRYKFSANLVKIPNGIDMTEFSRIGPKMAFGLTGKIVLSVGALEWYKYHDLAIKAVSKLTDISLVVVGKGPQKQTLINLGNQLLGERRFKILELNYEEMPKLYRSADLFTLPSWNREAFGIVYLEAMASGLAVVAPNDQTRKEIIGQAGILTDVFNSDKYAKAIEEALSKKWDHIPQNQAAGFSWDKIAQQYEQLIFNLCK